jgi:hypothetical protein
MAKVSILRDGKLLRVEESSLGFPTSDLPSFELPRVLSKAELWRRMSGEEVSAVYAAQSAITPDDPDMFRLRMIFEAVTTLVTTDADYPALREFLVAILGEERADVVLTPET